MKRVGVWELGTEDCWCVFGELNVPVRHASSVPPVGILQFIPLIKLT